MLFVRRNLPIYYALAVASSLLLVGILCAQAIPAKKQMVPIKRQIVPIDPDPPIVIDNKHTLPKKPAPLKKPAVPSAKQKSGDQVYAQRCASCHGAKGEGGKGYKRPLVGDLSVGELARFIKEEMPPEPMPKLPADDARSVADYIYGAFYSPIAQERNKPARIELSRLTVRQYRNAVTDLIGSFRRGEQADEKRGLRAKYFKTRKGDDLVLERVDPEIRFDFGTAVAVPEQDDPYQFVMRWEGSVLAPETGEYEFIVRTEQAAKLWINDLNQPLVNAEIKSGNSNEYRASIFLLGGRHYPLRLHFFKGVTGVNNLEKLKKKPVQPASIVLEWKMPQHAVEVIPQRCLFPAVTSQKFVPTTPFPPDDRSIGYERGTSVSKEWDSATTEAALETAGYVAANLRDLSGVKDDAPERDKLIREFCRKFVERAFRRPLTDEQALFFVERQFKSAANLETAVKRVVLLSLKSPRFLYREIGAVTSAAPESHDTASRLSFALWDSLPDDELLKAAKAGELATRAQVMRQAERMAADPRAWAKMRDFLLQWLKVEHYPDLAKDTKKFPGFDEAVASDLRTSFEMSLESLVWSEKSDFRELMLTNQFFLNGRLARMYGENLAPDAPFQAVEMNKGTRRGVLTHPYLLSSFAYIGTTSPIHRGVLISRSLLGRTLQPPPEAFTPLPAESHPEFTTRQRVVLQTKPAACSTCHTLINPLGFSLEKFDAIGSLRTHENGYAVDANGGYRTRTGQDIRFTGARGLADFLADSDEVHGAFVEKLFQHTIKQPIKAFGPHALSNLKQSFSTNRFNVRRQMTESAVLAAFDRRTDAVK